MRPLSIEGLLPKEGLLPMEVLTMVSLFRIPWDCLLSLEVLDLLAIEDFGEEFFQF